MFRKILLPILGLFFYGLSSFAFCASKGPLVLLSHDRPPYTIVAQKIKETFPESRVYSLEKIKRIGTDYQEPVVVCLGTKALRWAIKRPWQGKIVFSLVLELEPEIKESSFAKRGRLFGILLSFPPERYLFWLKQLFPQVKRVGFLATSKTQYWIDEFLAASKLFSFQSKIFFLSEPKKLENLLRKIATEVKALIVFPDPLFINYLTFPKLVFFAIEQEIILISISEKLAKAGALFSLGWDFSSISQQTVDLIRQILSNHEPNKQFFYPKKEKVYVNLRVLKALNLKIPSSLYGKIIFVGEGERNGF